MAKQRRRGYATVSSKVLNNIISLAMHNLIKMGNGFAVFAAVVSCCCLFCLLVSVVVLSALLLKFN